MIPDAQAPRSGAPGPGATRGPGLARILLLVLAAAALVAAGIALAPYLTRERIEGWVRGAGVWGPVVLLGIQAGQILAAPLPGVFVPVLAGLLYGPIIGPLITTIGTIIGSTAAYWIGRSGGRALVDRLLGPGPLSKAQRLLRGKRWMALIPLFLFPFSPADALCFIAGMVAMDWTRFLLAVLIGRLPKDALVAAGAALGWRALGF